MESKKPSLCRLCGEKLHNGCDKMASVNNIHVSKFKYSAVIRHATGIDVAFDKEGIHPLYLCESCVKKLIRFSQIPKRKTSKFKEKFTIVNWEFSPKSTEPIAKIKKSSKDVIQNSFDKQLIDLYIKSMKRAKSSEDLSNSKCLQVPHMLQEMDLSYESLIACELECPICSEKLSSYSQMLMHFSYHVKEDSFDKQDFSELEKASSFVLQHKRSAFLMPSHQTCNGFGCGRMQSQLLMLSNHASCGKHDYSVSRRNSENVSQRHISCADNPQIDKDSQEHDMACVVDYSTNLTPTSQAEQANHASFIPHGSAHCILPSSQSIPSASKSCLEDDLPDEGDLVIDEHEEKETVDPINFCSVSIDEESDNCGSPKRERNANIRAEHKKQCPFCQRLCSGTTALKRHILVHTGERPFACHLCSAAYTRKFVLQRHIEVQHPQSAENPDGNNQIRVPPIRSGAAPDVDACKKRRKLIEKEPSKASCVRFSRPKMLPAQHKNGRKHETLPDVEVVLPKCEPFQFKSMLDPDPAVLSELVSSGQPPQGDKFQFICEQCQSPFRYRAEYIYHLLHHDK